MMRLETALHLRCAPWRAKFYWFRASLLHRYAKRMHCGTRGEKRRSDSPRLTMRFTVSLNC